jgi:putative heme-binding domain-containing protein
MMGIIAKQEASGVTLRDLAGREQMVPTANVETLTAMPASLMPEGLLGGLSDAELRDFFSYLSKP